MDNLDFLQISLAGTAYLTVHTPNGGNFTFERLDFDIISISCPLLAMCFEDRPHGSYHSIEASSTELIARFLRFLYLGDYITTNYLGEEEPCSLLIHVELYRLANLFDVPRLMVEAHCNTVRHTELSCSLPSPPTDLCAAIRFIYTFLSDQQQLVDTILHYCVSCFFYHGLGKDEEFKKTAYEVQQFHKDLCQTNFRRGFSDPGAIDIIQLPVDERVDPAVMSERQSALDDFLYGVWGGDATSPRLTPECGPIRPSEPSYTFVHRPRRSHEQPACDESDGSSSDGSLSDAEGFSLVHRPKFMQPAASTHRILEGASRRVQDMDGEFEKEVPFYMQPNLADSASTIRPLLAPRADQRNSLEDAYSSDSEWSIVDKNEAQSKAFI